MKIKISALTLTLALFIGALALFSGCHKASTPSDTDTTAGEDATNAFNGCNDSKNVANAVIQKNQAEYSLKLKVSWNDTVTAKTDTMTINFGSDPVQCNDGIWREGELVVYWNKINGQLMLQAYIDSGKAVNMIFRNYAIGSSQLNMISMNGTRSWINNGGLISYLGDGDNESWIDSAKISLYYVATAKTASWISNSYNTLKMVGIFTSDTSGIWYFYYEVTGTASGVCQSGAQYAATIAGPVYYTAYPTWFGGCFYPENGQIFITRNNTDNTISVSYGAAGTCSNIANITLDGTSYNYDMP